jgi:EAL domain-containing protein (putative c-di-GMP-specific phosphodiesterase class I)
VHALIQLGHSLDLIVVAEGVASDAAAEQVNGLGCDLAQGYHYCRPSPGPELTGWLTQRSEPSALTEPRTEVFRTDG